jgi:hypothetical protein
MPVQITPEPNETERKAILAALAAEEGEERATSEWAAVQLPGRVETDDEP